MTCADGKPAVFTYADPCDPNRHGDQSGGGLFGDFFSEVGTWLGSFDFSQAYNSSITHCYLSYPPFSGQAAARQACIDRATGTATPNQNRLAGYGIAAGIVLVLVAVATRSQNQGA